MSATTDRSIKAGTRERRRIRDGEITGPTAGLAAGNVQANLVILPKALAHDFLRFAQANPKPCPVLAVSEPGDPSLPALGEDLDIRTDLPKYRVWRRGELVEEPADVRHVWRDDLVSFRAWLLVFVRAGDGRGRDRAPPHDLRLECADVSHQYPLRAGRPVCRSACRLDAAAEPAMRSARSRSPRAFRRCMARRFISACRRQSASATLDGRITATRCRCMPTNCRCFGPAASLRRPSSPKSSPSSA